MKINQPTISRGVQRINQSSVQSIVTGKTDAQLYDYSQNSANPPDFITNGLLTVTTDTGNLALFGGGATFYQNRLEYTNIGLIVFCMLNIIIVTDGTVAPTYLSWTLPYIPVQGILNSFGSKSSSGVTTSATLLSPYVNINTGVVYLKDYTGAYPGGSSIQIKSGVTFTTSISP